MTSIRKLLRMCDEKIINLFMKTLPKLKTVSWKCLDKDKNKKSGRINYFVFFVTIMKKSSLFYYYYTIQGRAGDTGGGGGGRGGAGGGKAPLTFLSSKKKKGILFSVPWPPRRPLKSISPALLLLWWYLSYHEILK